MSAFRRLGDFISRRMALRLARKKGAESGRLEQEPKQLGEGGEMLIKPHAVLAVETITDARLGRYLEDTAQCRAKAWEQIDSAPDKFREIQALEELHEQTEYPARFPVLKSRLLFAGIVVFVAALEAVLTFPALSTIREYAGWTQWVVRSWWAYCSWPSSSSWARR